MKNSPIHYVLGLIVFFACTREKLIEKGLPPFVEKLAVFCALTPGDSIKVHVELTAPLNGEATKPMDFYVFDANVLLEDDSGGSISLPLIDSNDAIYGVSQSEFEIKKGNTYYLSITTPNEEFVYATTRIPEKAAAWQSYEITRETSQDLDLGEYVPGVEITGKWEPLSGDEFGYLVETIKYSRYDYLDTTKTEFEVQKDYSNISSFSEIEWAGSFLSYSIETELEHTYAAPKAIWKLYKLESFLVTMNEDLIKYENMFQLMLDIYDYTGGGDFTEVYTGIIPEFSNIEGGIGIFGAYLTDKVNMEFNIE